MSDPEKLEHLETDALVRRLLGEEARVPEAVLGSARQLADLVDLAAESLRNGGRVVYAGAGTSGRLAAADAAECWSTFGVGPNRILALVAGGAEAILRPNPAAEDDEAAALQGVDELCVGPTDLVIGVTASGSTPFTLAAVRRAALRGAHTALITSGDAGGEAERTVKVEVGEEVLLGSTRLKAGTAAKIILGTFSTATMVRLGHTRGRDMTHLRANNRKLGDRAVRILERQAGCSEEQARWALRESDGEIGRAIDLVANTHGYVPDLADSPAKRGLYCIGIDAGATRIKIVAGKAGGIPAPVQLTAEGANFTTSPDRALICLKNAVAHARRVLGELQGPFASACIGAAGAAAESASQPIRDWARRELSPQTLVTNDAEPLLWDTHPAGTRIGLISGTGSFALGIDHHGRKARIGGWGWRFGGFGSSYALSTAAFAEFARSVDAGEPESNLHGAILRHWNARSAEELRTRLNRFEIQPAEIASTARLVVEAGEAGDRVARELLEDVASSLFQMVRGLVATLGTEEGVEVVGAGGLISHSALLRSALESRLAEIPDLRTPKLRLVRPARVLFERACRQLEAHGD